MDLKDKKTVFKDDDTMTDGNYFARIVDSSSQRNKWNIESHLMFLLDYLTKKSLCNDYVIFRSRYNE